MLWMCVCIFFFYQKGEWMNGWMDRGYEIKRGENRGKNKNRKHVKIQILWKHIDFKRKITTLSEPHHVQSQENPHDFTH